MMATITIWSPTPALSGESLTTAPPASKDSTIKININASRSAKDANQQLALQKKQKTLFNVPNVIVASTESNATNAIVYQTKWEIPPVPPLNSAYSAAETTT